MINPNSSHCIKLFDGLRNFARKKRIFLDTMETMFFPMAISHLAASENKNGINDISTLFIVISLYPSISHRGNESYFVKTRTV